MQRSHGSRVIFHSTNERSHWIKDNISNPNLKNSSSLKNANLNNSILLKRSVIVTVIVQQPIEFFVLRVELYCRPTIIAAYVSAIWIVRDEDFYRKPFHYNAIQYNAIQYNTISTIQYNAMQYHTIQYNTIQYNTIQYNTLHYNIIQYITFYMADEFRVL